MHGHVAAALKHKGGSVPSGQPSTRSNSPAAKPKRHDAGPKRLQAATGSGGCAQERLQRRGARHRWLPCAQAAKGGGSAALAVLATLFARLLLPLALLALDVNHLEHACKGGFVCSGSGQLPAPPGSDA